ncbi:MAG: uridine kinase [Lentimicrobium sp.]|nr:uridine kinase [Lentimicrobium sp.]
MLNDILLLNKKHENAAQTIFEKVQEERKGKYIITISGEVETGKCEVAHMLGRLMKNAGIKVKLLHMDNYYKIPPLQRTEWRKTHGIDSVGFEEYEWHLVYRNIIDFRSGEKSVFPCVDLFTDQIDHITTDFKGIEVLIIEGLYSVKIEDANLKVFIEMTYHETMEEQIKSGKEQLDEFRMQVLEREHQVVQSLKPLADFYLDFDTASEIFHY